MKEILIPIIIISFCTVIGLTIAMLITYLTDGKYNYDYWKSFWFGKL